VAVSRTALHGNDAPLNRNPVRAQALGFTWPFPAAELPGANTL
jgi:hypothetical protein